MKNSASFLAAFSLIAVGNASHAGFFDDLKSIISGQKDQTKQNSEIRRGDSVQSNVKTSSAQAGADWTTLKTPKGIVEWKLPRLDEYPWDSRYFDGKTYLVRVKQNGEWQISSLSYHCQTSPPSYRGGEIGYQRITSNPKFIVGYVAEEICRIRATVMGRDGGPQF